ncbi:MAG: glycine-rich protein [Acidimicrobiia bacterium]
MPANVTAVTVDVRGAQGGDTNGSNGGRGGRVVATLTVTPGSSLQIHVGGLPDASGSGGWNGGASAGTSAQPGDPLPGGGGGASDIRAGACAATLSCDFPARKVVAGGGGGAAGGFSAANIVGGGGGQTGVRGLGYFSGGGATSTAGGESGNRDNGGDALAGNEGVLGLGGSGGAAGSGGFFGVSAGAGGGGGYYGGGGGGGAWSSNLNSGAGGGGSSWAFNQSTRNARYFDASRTGAGLVRIAWATPTTTTLAANPSTGQVNRPITLRARVRRTSGLHPVTVGTVTFIANGRALTGCSNRALDEHGRASCTTTVSRSGTIQVTVRFKPSGGFAPSVSEARSITIS